MVLLSVGHSISSLFPCSRVNRKHLGYLDPKFLERKAVIRSHFGLVWLQEGPPLSREGKEREERQGNDRGEPRPEEGKGGQNAVQGSPAQSGDCPLSVIGFGWLFGLTQA